MPSRAVPHKKLRPCLTKNACSHDCNMNVERAIGFLLGVISTAGFVWALQVPLTRQQSMDINVRLITFPSSTNEDEVNADDDESSTGSVTLV